MSSEINHIYKFRNYALDLKEGVLLRDDKPLPVTPKVFHLLTILVENHGRIVEKEKLLAEIWADKFVEEGNLTFNVRMLRKALGDTASDPIFIETVPRRGYRFIAEVEQIAAEERIGVEGREMPEKRKRRSNQLFPAILSLILFAASVGAALWYLRAIFADSSTSAPILSAPFRSEKFSNSGSVRHAVISPDGRLAAYVDRTENKQGVWLRNLETSANIQLVAPSDDRYLGINFSHSGEQLFFVRKPFEDNALSGIYRISIRGGAAEKILERVEGWFSLAPDDSRISFVRCEKRIEDNCSLFVADADGRRERRILSRPKPFRISDNQFSPDGRSIAFAAGQSGNGGSDFRLMRVDLETGAENQISPKTFFNVENLEWLPKGDNLLLSASEMFDGKFKIWRVSALSGEAEPLAKDANSYLSISLNRNADKIIAAEVGDDFKLFVSFGGAARNLTSAWRATFAPDGKLFYSTREGDIWKINSDGTEQRQLTNDAANDFYPRISPDNQSIYFVSNRTGSNQVWRMTIDGGDQTQLTTKEGGYPCFVTPDGKWVYYESGLHQTLWRVSAKGGDETQISDRKMYAPAISPDGSLAAYFFLDKEWKIGIMSLADRKQTKILNYADGKSTAVRLVWSADNRTLNFISNDNSKNLLWRHTLGDDKPVLVADLGDKEIKDFALAPGGDGFAYVRGSWLHDAVLIGGFK